MSLKRIFKILELCKHPMKPSHLRSGISGTDYKKHIKILLDNDLVTYVSEGFTDRRGRGYKKSDYKEYIIITEEGKELLKLWREINRRIRIYED